MKTKTGAYLLASGVAFAATVMLAWLSLGVGVIGADGDPANVMYFAVIGVGLFGALIGRFRPQGMARALFATAFAQALVLLIALIARMGRPASPPLELLLLNGFFIALFVGAGLLFQAAAQKSSASAATGG